MTLFDKRTTVKPYEYPELLQYKDAIRHAYWLHTEFNYDSDVQNYHADCTDTEREQIKRAMLAIAQIEVNVKRFWGDFYYMFPKPEIDLVGSTFAESECHDDQTEILTDKGWVYFKDLDKQAKVAQYDIETEEVSFVVPKYHIAKHYEGKMHHYKSNLMDIMVTPGHDMYFENQAQDKIIKARSADITDKHLYVNRTGYTGSGDYPHELTTEQKALIHSISTKENQDEIFDWIELDRVNPKWGKAFIDELFDGEPIFYRCSKKAIDIVQAVIVLSGYSAYLSSFDLKNLFVGAESCIVYAVRLVDYKTSPYVDDVLVDYNGMVYCVTVESGMIVTRRNGKIACNFNCRHFDAYANLLELLGFNEEFQNIKQHKPLQGRTDYTQKFLEDKSLTETNKVLSTVLFSMFIEHISLFSQFLFIMSFNKNGNMFKGMSNAIEATSKEEQIHGDFGIEIYKILKRENPELFTAEFFDRLTALADEAFETEMEIVDWIYADACNAYISKDVLQEYLKNKFNTAFENLGLEARYKVDKEKLKETEWFELELNAVKEFDFFVKRSTDYTKRKQSYTEDDLF